jgi:predicted anti-sigma-YlaC factor YlaD
MIYGDEIACQQLVELVTDYFDGTLSPRQRELLEEHLKGCSGCRNYIEQMRQTIRLTGTINQDEVPTGVRSQLLDIFKQWKDPRPQE